MQLALLVGLGGFFGSLSRYLVTLGLQALALTPYPLATLVVNLIGSLIIGFLMAFGQDGLGQEIFHFLVPGILGGLTTYSAFSAETFLLLQGELYLQAIANIVLTVVGCLLASAFGFYLGRLNL